MTKKSRTILFIILTVLFIFSAPAMVLYSQGYRLDLNPPTGGIKITQTGGFYFKVAPKSVQIYLDGKLKEKTNFLFGSAFIDNLLPKKYEIKIEKNGYHPWQKSLEVREKEVTDAKNIVLIPKNPDFKILAEKTENFFFSPDEKKIILKKTNGQNWNLEIFNTEKNSFKNLIDEQNFNKGKADLLDLKWSPNSKKNLLSLKIKEKSKYFILDTTEKINLISLDFLGKGIKEISFSPQNDFEIFFIEKNALFKTDFSQKTAVKPILNNLISYKILGNDIIWLDGEGFIFKSDFSGKKIEALNLKPVVIDPKIEYKIIAGNSSKIFLQKSNALFFLEPGSKSFKEMPGSIKSFKFSSNFKKLAYWNNYEIRILFLNEKIEKSLFLTRFSKKIGNIFWYTPDYLIFNAEGKIKIAEIDDRDGINITDLAKFEKPKIFWNDIYKKLYILSNENFLISEKLLP